MQQLIIPPEVVTATGVGTGVVSYIMGWLEYNHSAISSLGILCGILIGCMGLYFQYKRLK